MYVPLLYVLLFELCDGVEVTGSCAAAKDGKILKLFKPAANVAMLPNSMMKSLALANTRDERTRLDVSSNRRCEQLSVYNRSCMTSSPSSGAFEWGIGASHELPMDDVMTE